MSADILRRPADRGATSAPEKPFTGFEHLTANYLYCPNQYFDVCLPNYSRGVVRLVAYVLRRTLGWLDENGSPIEQNVSISYRDLIEAVGISRGAIRPTIDEALQGGFLECTQPGRPSGPDESAQSARYVLRWDTDADYIKTAEHFRGFFAGEGHRSPIPNAFFDRVVPDESLAVVKVVGTVLRHTIGYHNQFGRRLQAPLSYSYIQRYAKLPDRGAVGRALHHALRCNYICRVEEGRVAANAYDRRPATYAVKWLEQATSTTSGSKNKPAPGQRFKNQSSRSSKIQPANRFNKQTKEKTPSNDTSKQQPAPAVAAQITEARRLLESAGFNRRIAAELARGRGLAEIQQQIDWLPHRHPSRNSLGLLRRAIEEDWSQPAAAVQTERTRAARERHQRKELEQTASEAGAMDQKRRRHERRQELLRQWQEISTVERTQYHAAAIAAASSDMLRRRLARHNNLDDPPLETLEAMADAAVARGKPS